MGHAPYQEVGGKSTDTSMEDILASLRKIIADDFNAEPPRAQQAFQEAPREQIREPLREAAKALAQEDDKSNMAYDAMRKNHEERLRYNQQARVQDRGQENRGHENRGQENRGQDKGQDHYHNHGFENPTARSQDDMRASKPYAGETMRDVEHEGGALLSSTSDAAITSSFEALTSSLALQKNLAIETLAREMLRPMLKSWLDEHLPAMVERLVCQEIERVARGNRG